MRPRVCVVIPTYNEADHLPRLLPLLFAQADLIPSHELWVLVVDDHSPDGTFAVVERLRREYPRLRGIQGKKEGLGRAYQRGFEYARLEILPELLVQMDGDLQHDPLVLPQLIARCGPGTAAVIGSRFAAGGSTPTFSTYRRVLSRAGNWLIHRAAGLPYLHDYTSGYRCLRAELVWQCDFFGLATRGYAYLTSLIAQMLMSGEEVAEIPITFGARDYGISKLSRREYTEFLRNLVRLRKWRKQAALRAPLSNGAQAAKAARP